jgi:hypothetical protein
MSLKAWKDLYPEALIIGPANLVPKVHDVKFDFTFTPERLDGAFGDNEILVHFFPGYFSKELSFLHVPTGTFFNADLADNLPAFEAFSKTDVDPTKGFWTALFMKIFSPHNFIHNAFYLHYFTIDKK